MRKILSYSVALFVACISITAQVPKADLLDVVFNEDGTATDISNSKMTVELFGTPNVVESPKYGINVACFHDNGLNHDCTYWYKVDYGTNVNFKDALADGHSIEVVCRLEMEGEYTDNLAADEEVKPFSSLQGGGTGFLICKQNRGLYFDSYNEWTFMPHVGGGYVYANSGVLPTGGEYIHLVGVWDKEKGEARIYVNGELKYTNPTANGDFKHSSLPYFVIGGDPGGDAGANTSFKGDVAIARVYDDPLTGTQITSLYNAVKIMDTGADEHEECIREGLFKIGTAEELELFCEMVNNGNTTLNAVLTKDIDYSGHTTFVGTSTHKYAGIFDGAQHTITVDFNRTSNNAALFEYLSGTVKNLAVQGNITTSAKYAAGIAAHTYHAKVLNCVSLVNISSNTNGDGTHAGLIAVNEDDLTISDCIFLGSITGATTINCAGIVGWTTNSTIMDHCVVIADLSGLSLSDDNTFTRNANNATITNCYYNKAHGRVEAGKRIYVAPKKIENGEICFRINGDQSTIHYYQTIGKDPYPVPWKSNHGIVIMDNDGNYMNTPEFTPYELRGDMNGDGKLSIEDVTKLVDLIMKKE